MTKISGFIEVQNIFEKIRFCILNFGGVVRRTIAHVRVAFDFYYVVVLEKLVSI